MTGRAFRRRAVGWKAVVEGGFRFASRGEADRFKALAQQHAGLRAEPSDSHGLLVCTAPGVMETFRLAGVPAANKYRAKKQTIDGRTFDSGHEARRYVQLRALAQAGEITDLQCQVPYEFVINGIRVGKFTADFEYVLAVGPGRGEVITEDAKSAPTKTEAYQLRKKLLWACHRIVITEV